MTTTLTDAIAGSEAVLGRKLTNAETVQVGSIVESGGSWAELFSYFGDETTPSAITVRMRELAGDQSGRAS